MPVFQRTPIMQLKVDHHWPASETPFNGFCRRADGRTLNAGLGSIVIFRRVMASFLEENYSF